MVAPGALGYDGTIRVVHLVAGPVIVAVGLVSASAVMRGLRRVAYPIGLLVAVAPLTVGGSVPAVIVGVTAGSAAALLSVVPVGRPGRFGGGWTALVDPSRLAPDQRRARREASSPSASDAP